MSNKEHAWWAVLIKGKRGNPKNKENGVGGGNPQVEAIIYCKVHAKVTGAEAQESGTKRYLGIQICVGQRAWLHSAQRLRPHGMPMPYFGWTRLGQGPARTREKQD